MQLNLFTNIQCSICGRNPGIKPENPYLWNGFYDNDLKATCCRSCTDVFYQKKNKQLNLPPGAMIYSERPVMAINNH